MSLADRKPPKPNRMVCGVCSLLNSLPPKEAEALTEMLASSEWRSTWIEDALSEEGYSVSPRTITRHRAGRCRGLE